MSHPLEGDGNAFAILGRFKRAMRADNYDPEELNRLMKDAQSADYDHLLQVVMREYGTE